MRLCPFPVFAVIFSPVFVRPAKVFLALAVLSVAASGCFKIDPIVDGTDTCDWSGPAPIYEIVNKTKEAISWKVQEDIDYYFPGDSFSYLKDNSIRPGGVRRGWLVYNVFIQHSWYTDVDNEVVIVPTNLVAIRLNQSTIVYYTGYPESFSNDLSTWLKANQSKLPSSFYTPRPKVDNMDAYGLFYVVRNAGRTRLGLPTKKPNECDVYTSLDPLNRPHIGSGFVMTFTVNGPDKSDIHISYKGTPR